MRDDEYLAIKDRAAEQFLKIPHVNAVGIGGREKNGLPIAACVARFCAALCRFGSAALKADVTRLHPRLPSIAELSLNEILAGLDAALRPAYR